MTDEFLPIVPGRMPWTKEPPAPAPAPPHGEVTYFTPTFVDDDGNSRLGVSLGDTPPPQRNCAISIEADAWNASMTGHPLRSGSNVLAMG